jgi:outer membrane protein assembly factor BamB
VYVPTVDDRVVALAIETGTIVWEHRLGGPPNDILATDDRIYVGSNDNFFYCLKAENGGIAWRWQTGGDVVGLPIADDDRVYFVSLDNVLRGLDRRNGSQLWKRALPFRPISGPVRVTDAIVVVGLSATLPAFAARDGAPVGDVMASGEVTAPPGIVTLPNMPMPVMVVVTRDIAKGATAAAVTRAIDPVLAPLIQLPNAAIPKPEAPKGEEPAVP